MIDRVCFLNHRGITLLGWVLTDWVIVWEAAAADERSQRDGKIAEQMKLVDEIRRRKEEIRKSGQSGVPGGSL